jgi:hypothetical protein
MRIASLTAPPGLGAVVPESMDSVGRASPHDVPASTSHVRWAARNGVQLASLIVFLSVTIFVRFGITVGKNAIDCSLIALYLFVALGLVFECFEVSATRLTTYGALIVAAVLSYSLNSSTFGSALSIPSLLLYLVLYAPFILSLKPGIVASNGDQAASQFLAVALVCAVAGTAQFYLQFVIHGQWLFDYTYLIPEALQGTPNFNTVYNIGLFTKSNGFFLREPSEFSLLMALAIIVEWSRKRRPWCLACFVMGLLLAYSGTGILTLAIALLVPFNYKVLVRIVVAVGVVALVVLVVGDALRLDVIMRRISEFGSSKSSGYKRYIAPAFLVQDGYDDTSWTPWFGHGPGMISRVAARYMSHDPTWAKSLFEYGVVGFVLVCALLIMSLYKPLVPLRLRVVLFMTWLVTGGHLLSAPSAAMRLCLVGFIPAVVPSLRAAGRARRLQPHASSPGVAWSEHPAP